MAGRNKQAQLKAKANKKKKETSEQEKTLNSTGKKIARRGIKQTRRTLRRFGGLMVDTTRSLFGGGQRRVNRRSNRTISGRFINDLITLAETTHLAGLHVDLSEILVEPRFLPTPDLIEPIAENDILREVFYVVPRMPDLPYILPPYNLPNYRIEDIVTGHRKLAILGQSGSGRTTALMAIALWTLGEIYFDEPDDPVKRQIAAQEEELTEEERAELERKRKESREAAKEQLEIDIQQGNISNESIAISVAEALEQEENAEALPDFDTLLPIYIHCADLTIAPGEYGGEIDPAEPLVRAAQFRVGALTARTIPGLLYERLEQNRTLILLDGYDDLPAARREVIEAWLHAFDKRYGNNFLIMTGPALGYGRLTKLGMTPLFIKPWNNDEINTVIDKWAAAWPNMAATQGQDGQKVNAKQLKNARYDNYALSAAEITLKVWSAFTDDNSRLFLDEWVNVFLDANLPETYRDDENVLPILKVASALQVNQGSLTLQAIETILRQQERTRSETINQSSLDELELQSAEADMEAVDEEDDEEQTERRRLLNELVFSGILVRFRNGRLRFRHQILADYLASLTLQPLPEEDPATLYELAQKPSWTLPLRYAALHTDLSKVVEMKLNANEDLLQSNLIELASWVSLSKPTTPWRSDVMHALGNTFVHPKQFISNRERIGAALINTRNVEHTLEIYRHGLESDDPDLRRIACLAAAAMDKYGQQLSSQVANLIRDPNPDVRVAAVHALVALGNEEAKDAVLASYMEGDELMQQAAAEALAAVTNEGYLTLYESTDLDSLDIRRAALFGLRRIRTEWARELVRQRFLTEDEFMVRVVAQEGFINEQLGNTGPKPPQTADQVEWVQEWALGRRRSLPQGEASNQVFMEILKDPDIVNRAYGAILLGQLGVMDALHPLYNGLLERDQIIQESAYRGLIELQIKLGKPLPNPV